MERKQVPVGTTMRTGWMMDDDGMDNEGWMMLGWMMMTDR